MSLKTIAILISFINVAQAGTTVKEPAKCLAVKKELVTSEIRSTCLKEATLSLGVEPVLTAQQLFAGPPIPEIAMQPNDPVYCNFAPHSWGGDSKKFFCFMTTKDGVYYNTKMELVPGAVSVNAEEELLGASGAVILTKKGKSEKAHRIKVKYVEYETPSSKIPSKAVKERYREVFTEVVATRVKWALGLASDSVYSTTKLTCNGCVADPYGKKQTAFVKGSSWSPPDVVSFDHTMDGKTIQQKLSGDREQGFLLSEIEKNVPNWSPEKQVDFYTMLTFLNLINHHNMDAGKGFQNRLFCAHGFIDDATKECSKPVASLDDVGSTFGGNATGLFSTNPRGDWGMYSKHKMFKTGCQFTISGDKITTLTKPMHEAVLKRMESLRNYENVRSMFEAAHFDLMDWKQLQALKKSGVVDADLGKAAIKQWADKFYELVKEFESANCN